MRQLGLYILAMLLTFALGLFTFAVIQEIAHAPSPCYNHMTVNGSRVNFKPRKGCEP
jgi:hypothetical protein